jgi:uncharacterized protein YqhQ
VQVIKKSRGIGFLVRIFSENDPLHFRTESLFIILTIILFIILYSVGIVSVMNESAAMSPIVITRTVIQIFMEILAFGGYIFIVTLNKYIILKRNGYMIQENNEDNKTNNSEELLEMLRNELGYQVMYQYCQMEFSL